MHPFLYTTLWMCLSFYLVYNVDGGDAERGKPSGRIKGGEKASIGQFPWAVALRAYHKFARGKVQCGGSIIGSKWVVTAAHCTFSKPAWITAGKTEGSSQYLRDRYYIKRYTVHPTFNVVYDPPGNPDGDVISIQDDIAILELKTELNMSGSVEPIRLSQTDVQKNQQCQMVGWGYTDGKGHVPSELMKMNVKIARSCNRYRKVFLNPGDNICSRHSAQWACKGDSGGPLICKEENDHYFLKGVQSVSTPCDQKNQGIGVYVKVNNYVEWIEQVTKLDLGFKEDRPPVYARTNQKIANARSAMNNGGNPSDTHNLHAISAEELNGLPRPDELNELDGSYTLDTDTAQPEPRGNGVPDDTKSGLDNHARSPMSTNSASTSLTTSKIVLFVCAPIFIIILVVLLGVAIVVIRKSSHQKKDSLEITEPGTK